MSAFQEMLYWFKTDARTEKHEFINLWGTSSKNGVFKKGSVWSTPKTNSIFFFADFNKRHHQFSRASYFVKVSQVSTKLRITFYIARF